MAASQHKSGANYQQAIMRETVSGKEIHYNIGIAKTDLEYTWMIPNFKHYMTNYIAFTLEFQIHQSRILVLDFKFLQHYRVKSLSWLCVDATCKGNISPPTYSDNCRISLLNKKGDKCYTTEITYEGRLKFVEVPDLTNPDNGLIIDDKVILHFSVSARQNKLGDSLVAIKKRQKKAIENYAANISSLWETRQYADFVFVVRGVEFKVHKSILSTRSKVFAAMITQDDTSESVAGKLVIDDDITAEIFGELLKFVYTANIPGSELLTADLLSAADKYQILELKSACENELASTLTIKNVTHKLVVAHNCNALYLKAKCIDFIIVHSEEVFKDQEWMYFEQNKPALMNETYREMIGSLNRDRKYITKENTKSSNSAVRF